MVEFWIIWGTPIGPPPSTMEATNPIIVMAPLLSSPKIRESSNSFSQERPTSLIEVQVEGVYIYMYKFCHPYTNCINSYSIVISAPITGRLSTASPLHARNIPRHFISILGLVGRPASPRGGSSRGCVWGWQALSFTLERVDDFTH